MTENDHVPSIEIRIESKVKEKATEPANKRRKCVAEGPNPQPGPSGLNNSKSPDEASETANSISESLTLSRQSVWQQFGNPTPTAPTAPNEVTWVMQSTPESDRSANSTPDPIGQLLGLSR